MVGWKREKKMGHGVGLGRFGLESWVRQSS